MSPRTERAQLKKQLSYAENEKEQLIILSLKIHIGSMLEYNYMSKTFASSNGFGHFCDTISRTYQTTVEQDYANVDMEDLNQYNEVNHNSKQKIFPVTKVSSAFSCYCKIPCIVLNVQ